MPTLSEEADAIRARDQERAYQHLSERAAVEERLRKLREEVAAAKMPPHPMGQAAVIAETHPYRTDFLNSWTPQYAKTQRMWENDQRRAMLLEGTRRIMNNAPYSVRGDLPLPDRQVIESLRSPTTSAGIAPPWSGAARMGNALAAPAGFFGGIGLQANRALDAAIGRPDIRPEAGRQMTNTLEDLAGGIPLAYAHALTGREDLKPRYLQQYEDWVRSQESKPVADIEAEYIPRMEDEPVYLPRMFGEAFPDAPLAVRLPAESLIGMATDPVAPYAGVSAAQLPRAFAKDAAFGLSQEGALMGLLFGLTDPEAVARRQESGDWLRYMSR